MSKVTVSLEELVRLKAEARGFSLLPKQPVSSLLAGRHNSRMRGRGLAFEELRHYHEGDDVRSIDWRATARLRSPHIRVFSEERERPILLVVDQRRPLFFGSRRAMKSVAAAEFAALLSWRTRIAGDRVGGIIFNEDEIVRVRPRPGSIPMMRVFHEICRMNHHLAETRTATGTNNLNDALRSARVEARHDHFVVVISDLDGADDQTREHIVQLGRHNDVMVVAVYDPLGAQLSGGAGMRATDRGKSWDIPDGADFQKKFRASFQNLTARWMDLFRDLRIPVFPLSTASPVIGQIHELLGSHE